MNAVAQLSPVAEVAHHAATTPGDLRRWRTNDVLHRMETEMRLQRQMAHDHGNYLLAGGLLTAALARATEHLTALDPDKSTTHNSNTDKENH